MTRVLLRICLGAALGMSLGSCAGAPSAPLTCSPDRALEVRFGYQSIRYPVSAAPEIYVMNQNGAEYLFIDGECRYWAYFVDDGPAGSWNDVRTGILTEAQLAGVNAELIERYWDGVAGEVARGTGSSHYQQYVWHDDSVASCTNLCDTQSSEAASIREAARRWTRDLHAVGTPIASDHMRVLAQPFEGPLDAYPFVEWTGSPLSALADASVARGTSPPFRVDRADVDAIRTIRAPLVAGEMGSFVYRFLPLLADGAPFSVWARETIPLEDENGRIRPPGYASAGF